MLGFLRYLTSCFTLRNQHILHSSVHPNEFRAAGTFFTDGKTVLAGFQPHKSKPMISGIGGRRHIGETYLQTAIRETVEELFELEFVPKELIQTIERKLKPKQVFQNGSYIYVVYSFKDLEHLLRIVKKYGFQSRVYTKHPRTILELLQTRIKSSSAEIQSLQLLPISNDIPIETDGIDPNLLEDIALYKRIHDTNDAV